MRCSIDVESTASRIPTMSSPSPFVKPMKNKVGIHNRPFLQLKQRLSSARGCFIPRPPSSTISKRPAPRHRHCPLPTHPHRRRQPGRTTQSAIRTLQLRRLSAYLHDSNWLLRLWSENELRLALRRIMQTDLCRQWLVLEF